MEPVKATIAVLAQKIGHPPNSIAAGLLGNLKRRIKDDEKIRRLVENNHGVQREEICRKF